MLSKVEVNLQAEPEHNRVRIETLCRLTGKTGVEMEALTAASVAALTIYDMCKAVQKRYGDWSGTFAGKERRQIR